MTLKQLAKQLQQEKFDAEHVQLLVRFNGGEITTPIVGLELDTANKIAYFDVAAEFANGDDLTDVGRARG